MALRCASCEAVAASSRACCGDLVRRDFGAGGSIASCVICGSTVVEVVAIDVEALAAAAWSSSFVVVGASLAAAASGCVGVSSV